MTDSVKKRSKKVSSSGGEIQEDIIEEAFVLVALEILGYKKLLESGHVQDADTPAIWLAKLNFSATDTCRSISQSFPRWEQRVGSGNEAKYRYGNIT